MNTFLNKKNRKNIGFTIIEVIIACTIISLTSLSLISATQKGMELSSRALKQVQANFLLEEGAEAIKSIRDNDWSDIGGLTLETNYYLFFNLATNKWFLQNSDLNPENSIPSYPVDSLFNRHVFLSSVYRDLAGDIVQEGGSLDERTKKVTVIVSWLSSNELISKELVFYLADIFN